MKISGFKLISIIVIILLAGCGGLMFFISNNLGLGTQEVVNEKLLQNAAFLTLHQTIRSLKGMQNIAVLPDSSYIVVNGVVINRRKHTFGQEPDIGFYNAYYEEGNKHSYISLNKLLLTTRIELDSTGVLSLIRDMRRLGINDIAVENGMMLYRWDVSAMYGEEGIIYSEREFHKASSRFDIVEPLGNGFYHVAAK